MKRACIGVFVLLAAIVVALAVAGGLALRGGISARVEPTQMEARVARAARGWAIPGWASAARNPIAATERTIKEGGAHFADHCASCHGNDGSGDTALGRNMYPRAPDMRAAATQALTDGELHYIVENGVRFTGMPGWGGAGRPEESWKLVHFIRRLPRLGPEEIAEMKRLNPKSAHEWRELQEEEEFLGGSGNMEEGADTPRPHGGH